MENLPGTLKWVNLPKKKNCGKGAGTLILETNKVLLLLDQS